jgi:hypothetical protein|tara:strand:- start:329 stop:859 length:531 start_codon:yes stop_codon:yes gene_type:complete
MSTTYGDRPLRVTFTSSDSSGVAEFFDGSETGAIGITVPRFTTTERNAVTASTVKQGMIIFNETDGKMQVYTGSDASNTSSNWTDIGGGTILADADGNTNIEIGATTSDEIDVDIAGTKIATLDAVGINIEAGAIGVRHAGTITGTATIAAGENIGLFGDVTFTGTVTVAGEMVVV